ncbi:MAG: hypothetical protein QG618_1229, partial [Thermodesulfobacteriota bacterium]|nr:hypothetical protein [Thermodesulfobacteriota bacterium]
VSEPCVVNTIWGQINLFKCKNKPILAHQFAFESIAYVKALINSHFLKTMI